MPDCTKHCSWKFSGIKELSARLIVCLWFCDASDIVCVKNIVEPLLMATASIWFIGVIFFLPPSLPLYLTLVRYPNISGRNNIGAVSFWLENIIPASNGLISLSNYFSVKWWLFGIPRTRVTPGSLKLGAIQGGMVVH